MLRVRAPVSSAADSAFQWCLEVPAPESIAVGHGSAVHLVGWCFHRDAPIRDLRFVAAGKTIPAVAHSLPRPDVRAAFYPERDPNENSYASGFYAVIPLPGVAATEDLTLLAKVELPGSRTEEHAIDTIKLVPKLDIAPSPSAQQKPVVIAMTTYNPRYDLFARQIESITQQSYADWRCIISDDRSHPAIFNRIRQLLADDDRFVLDRGYLHLGAYRNFERALALVGSDALHVALADQDDRWYPSKLEKLISSLGGDATLTYSDCRLIKADGTVLSQTFFSRRRNNWSDLRKLLLGNTVTGASAMFRADLLDYALPFPPSLGPGVSFHDHWLACTALTLGRIHYLDEPLYDYVQHDENVLGHALGRTPQHAYRGPWMLRSRASYQTRLMRTVLMATALEQRFDGRMSGAGARELRQLADVEQSNAALARTAIHAIGSRSANSEADGGERDLLNAVAWRRAMSRSARRRDRIAHPWYSAEPHIIDGRVLVGGVPGVQRLSDLITPLALQVSNAAPTRVNFLMRRIALDNVLDNDIGKLSLVAALVDAGLETRVIVAGDDLPTAEPWTRLQEIPGTPAVDRHPEIIGTQSPVRVSPADIFVATDWSTAHAAHDATVRLRRKCFAYLIDEYAGDRAPPELKDEMSRIYALSHCALFWNQRLEAWFRSRELGIFSPRRSHELPFATVEPPVRRVDIADSEFSTARASRALLFHAPSDPDTGESMLDLGLLALDRVADRGLLSGWEVNTIGTPMRTTVRLTPEHDVVMVDPTSAPDYEVLLRGHDLGMSLVSAARLTPVALEMAAAGLPTVVFALDRADRRWLEATSANLVPVQPNLEELVRGLAIALERVTESDRLARVAALPQPNTWRESLNPAVLDQIGTQLAICGEDGIKPLAKTGRALRRVKRTLMS